MVVMQNLSMGGSAPFADTIVIFACIVTDSIYLKHKDLVPYLLLYFICISDDEMKKYLKYQLL